VDDSNQPNPTYQLAMAAHTLAIQVNAESKMHQAECTATRVRNEGVFAEIKANINAVDSKMDQQTMTLMRHTDDKAERLASMIEVKNLAITQMIDAKNLAITQVQSEMNKKLYLIIGGITLGGFVLERFAANIHF